MKNITVTVLIAMYNESDLILQTLETILKQTWTDFELVVIDDGSTDNSVELVSSINDSRIKLYSNQENLGVCRTLQRGIYLSRGTYIARIDADDLAEPERLEKQIKYLKAHPDSGIVGSSCILFNSQDDNYIYRRVPITDLQIRWTSLLNSPFISSSVMFRKKILTENNLNYDEVFSVAEDYELWTRLLNMTKGFNFCQPLVKYRLRNGLTRKCRDEMLKNHDFIAHRTIRSTLPDFPITLEQVTLIRSLLITEDFYDEMGNLKVDQLQEAITLYLAMLSAFLKANASHHEKNHLKWQEIYKISRLLLRLSKRAGFDIVLAPQLRSLTRLLWK